MEELPTWGTISLSPSDLTERFRKLFQLCHRVEIWVSEDAEDKRWKTSPHTIFIVSSEVVEDKDEGIFAFAHELSHVLLTGVGSIHAWYWRWYREGKFAGLAAVLAKEYLAWIGGFLILAVLRIKISPKAFARYATSRAQTCVRTWKEVKKNRSSTPVA